MGKPDAVTKNYLRRPDIFADVFNKFLYHGKQKILPEMLTELDTTEIAVPYGADGASVPEQRYRDVAKLLAAMTDRRTAYCILAVESEKKINYAMPVKDGLYDFMQLAKQVSETARLHKKSGRKGEKPNSGEFLSGFWKSDRLLPVVTLVVYFGPGRWDGPLSLREMYGECDEEVLKYAADYHVNLISPDGLSDDELDEFQTNFREIMKYIKYSSDGERLKEVVNMDERFKDVERQAVDVINTVTGSEVEYSEEEEKVDMCIAIQQIKAEGRLEGRIEGELIGVIRSDRRRRIPRDDTRQYLMEEYQKSGEEVDELLAAYWK